MSAELSALATVCSGDEGCQETSPNKTTPGLCFKCIRIRDSEGADKEKWQVCYLVRL